MLQVRCCRIGRTASGLSDNVHSRCWQLETSYARLREYRFNSDLHFKLQPLRRIAAAVVQAYTTVVPLPPSLVVIVKSGELDLMGKVFRLRFPLAFNV